ncbi:hypothetical protein BS78_06G054300 [Paspalum vaginatum]|nr:hypothetical protein BS78_06G054300 [Paspalum vaginatum]KAJ1270467.1 hypothetical protein BS78_06G054300 [Paspalum vaginatum]KAJ1270468.1 hypothetical protein BS78_06G054300 [Paspalum vaginatum]KAJ1270469.1 hypothetical protein BS78_06G054300 [Paspalum vaginatum]
MEPAPYPPSPHPSHPPPSPPPALTSVLAHLRSLLSAASSTLAALPSPLQPHPTTPLISIPSTKPTTATPPLPPPATAINLPLPAAPGPYSDCPAVVRTTPTPIPVATSLPAFLAAECADVSSSSAAPSPSPPPRILPSELILLRRELDSWGAGVHHLPGSCSYAVTRVAASFRLGVTPRWEAELRQWMLESSPRYGVKVGHVDVDNIWVLLWLFLKATAVEAMTLLGEMKNGSGTEGLCFDPRSMRLECPRLVEGVSWLGSQLGVLYGESNGRLFVLAAVKEAVLRMAYCLVVGVGHCAAGGGEGNVVGDGRDAGEKGSNARDVAGPVFLSQVAAAMLALYERFSLKEKAKALQAPRLSKYQLLLEYSQALERGNLERSNRPNYRAVLEYDGILSRRVENQESARAKTREELLAEERDYKRRRTSYRGKKVNRNPTEILRDIIDEHMEEIKQAGGIGCFVEAPADITQNVLKSNSHGSTYQGSYDFASSSSHDKATLGHRSPSYDNLPHADSLGRFSSRTSETRDSYKTSRYETHGNRYQNISENENKLSIRLENEIDQSDPYQQENHRRQRSANGNRNYSYKYKKKNVSDHGPESSDRTEWSTESQRSSVTEYAHMPGEVRSDRSRASQKRRRSLSVTQDQFSDRYDPKSTYSDADPVTSMLYDATEGKCERYHDKGHRHGHHERKHDHHR